MIKRFLAGFILLSAPLFAAQYELLSTDTPLGRVEVSFTTDADSLSLERDLTATLTATAPAGAALALPQLDELRARFEGFSLAEGYGREDAPSPDGRTVKSIRWRLRADPGAARYRLAPFAVAAAGKSFVASPVLFPLASLPDAQGGIEIAPRKFFVWPSPKTLLRWLLTAALAAVVVAIVVFFIRRIRRTIRIRAMSPAERALHELSQLLGRGLIERGRFKDYYVELTLVVRRYVERAYGIRAPRLTTEEFLERAKADSRFGEDSVAHLSSFLEAADMVKFAGLTATVEMATAAADSARRYVQQDSTPKVQTP